MNEGLQFSALGESLLRGLEGCRLVVYKDEGGKMTVGIGHLVSDKERLMGRFDRPLTLDGAAKLLKEDLAWVEREVRALVKVPLSQSQYDALVCFIFNAGPLPLHQGLGRTLNTGDYASVPREMRRWVHVQDPTTKQLRKSPNLVARREREIALWMKEPAPSTPPSPPSAA